MAKRRNRQLQAKRARKKKRFAPRSSSVVNLLEQGTLAGMQAQKDRTAALLKCYWDYYSELALQRSQIQEEIKKVLMQACLSGYRFEKWQRAVKWKHGLHPLSTVGSLTYIGGRFNTGSDVNSEVPSFPALYLAIDKDTALQETLGTKAPGGQQLTPRELALTNPQSEVIVSVSGELEKVIDLTSAESLKGFTALINGFHLSDTLRATARSLKLPEPKIITTPKQLLATLLQKKWRQAPSMFDVPANSQIFGHLICQAGIEGILFPSSLSGKNCLAIFPQNFAFSSSFVTLDDEPPHPDVPRKIDSNNWRLCELSAKELIGS